MKARTTLLLLLLVLGLGLYIGLVEQREGRLAERRARALRALRILPERVIYIRFEIEDRVIECVREAGQWNLVQPVQARADSGEMDRLLTAIAGIDKGEVITGRERRDQNLTLADYGLERSRARITIDEGMGPRVLHIGRAAPLGDMLYLMQEGREDIVSASALLWDLIPRSITNLRDRVVLRGDPARTHRVEIRRTGGFLQMARDENNLWRIQQPVVSRADRAAVRQLLDPIFDLRIVEFVAEDVSDATMYGLDDSAVQIGIWLDNKETGQTLILGRPRETDPERIYAKWRNTGSVFSVPREILDVVSVRANDLRDRQLLPLRDYDIDRVELLDDERPITLERNAEGAWRIVEPRQWRADEQRVAALIRDWTGARVHAFIDDPGTNLLAEVFPPSAPRIVFRRKTASAAPSTERPSPAVPDGTVTVQIGVPTGTNGLIMVKRSRENTVYEITNAVMENTSWDPLHYRRREVVTLDPAMVRRVSVMKFDAEQTALRRAATEPFVAVAPTGGVAQEAGLADILRLLRSLVVLRYEVDSPPDLAPYGLDRPSMTLTLGLSGEAGISRTLMLGRASPDGGVYAMTRGQDLVFVLDASIARRLEQDIVIVPEPAREGAPEPAGTGARPEPPT